MRAAAMESLGTGANLGDLAEFGEREWGLGKTGSRGARAIARQPAWAAAIGFSPVESGRFLRISSGRYGCLVGLANYAAPHCRFVGCVTCGAGENEGTWAILPGSWNS
jgi:hypothetical protein